MSAAPTNAELTVRTERLRKGDATRAAIVDAALAIARREGLEGLTIGALADALQMSKSGVFAHFGSREDLQLSVLQAYADRFVDDVLRPAVRAARGLPRLQALLDNWVAFLAREIEQGCLMISGASEYDDRPGPLREAMVRIVTGWRDELLRAIRSAVETGHLRDDLDAEQLVFEIYGVMLVLHQDARLLRSGDSVRRARGGLGRLLSTAAVDVPAVASAAARVRATARKAAARKKATPKTAAPRAHAPAARRGTVRKTTVRKSVRKGSR